MLRPFVAELVLVEPQAVHVNWRRPLGLTAARAALGAVGLGLGRLQLEEEFHEDGGALRREVVLAEVDVHVVEPRLPVHRPKSLSDFPAQRGRQHLDQLLVLGAQQASFQVERQLPLAPLLRQDTLRNTSRARLGGLGCMVVPTVARLLPRPPRRPLLVEPSLVLRRLLAASSGGSRARRLICLRAPLLRSAVDPISNVGDQSR
mmetsp:Transcript_120578/g.348458  ORF Transcript_120578/g.348458 Transcript_120578/m.348458 type:complete len:204 (+) Transcript_120578:1767-2378(+)